jgi:hypothetical protein
MVDYSTAAAAVTANLATGVGAGSLSYSRKLVIAR